MSINKARFDRVLMSESDRKAARQWGMAATAATVETVTARPRFTLPRVTESFVLKALTVAAVVSTLATFAMQDTTAATAAPARPVRSV